MCLLFSPSLSCVTMTWVTGSSWPSSSPRRSGDHPSDHLCDWRCLLGNQIMILQDASLCPSLSVLRLSSGPTPPCSRAIQGCSAPSGATSGGPLFPKTPGSMCQLALHVARRNSLTDLHRAVSSPSPHQVGRGHASPWISSPDCQPLQVTPLSSPLSIVSPKQLTSSPTALETARFLTTHIFRLHGIPGDIVLDRGPQFTSRVWKEFCSALGAA